MVTEAGSIIVVNIRKKHIFFPFQLIREKAYAAMLLVSSVPIRRPITIVRVLIPYCRNGTKERASV